MTVRIRVGALASPTAVLQLSVVLLLACLAGGPKLALGQESPSARVVGTVVEAETGQAIGGAVVSVLPRGPRVTTDAAGRFVVAGLPAGTHRLHVSAAGKVDAEETFTLGPAEERRLVLKVSAQAFAATGVTTLVDRLSMVGDPSRIAEIPGSAHYLDAGDLGSQNLLFDDVHRVLRQVPGVNLQDEEGFGQRANIGLRGTGSERSSKITLMEDGVLVAPAPYAAPAAYYSPLAGRMEAIEVRKGSSQIKYGPLTTGGAVNLISSAIPDELRLRADLAGGDHGTAKLHAKAGDSYRTVGWLLETYRLGTGGFKELDGGGPTGYDVEDYLVKLRLNAGPDARVYQELELKLGLTDEVSDETYLGLADLDFRTTPYRRYAASGEDVLRAEHEQLQARWHVRPSRSLDVTAVLYRNDFHRNWYKLQDVNGKALDDVLDEPELFATELGILRGATSDPGALRVRANNRSYYGQGLQTIVGLTLGGSSAFHELELGARYHEDQEDRFQHDDRFRMVEGEMELTSRGVPGSQSNRVSDARAWAFFAQDRIAFGELTVSPGLRYERIRFTRTDYFGPAPLALQATPGVPLGDLETPSGSARGDSSVVRENGVDVLIPGMGVSWAPGSDLSFFAGVHRGFAPPGPGTDEDAEPEESVNYELGGRYRRGTLGAQLVGFHNDYRNILGKATLATGESGTDELFNGGGVDVSGVELSLDGDLGAARGIGVAIPLRLAYTFTRATFTSSFVSEFEPWGTVEAGDELPYVPEQQLFASLGLAREAWRLGLTASYTSAMRAVAGRGPIEPGEGTDAHVLLGATGEYAVTPWSTLFAGVQNLTDEVYVASRRPAGARPGLPRTLMAGVRLAH